MQKSEGQLSSRDRSALPALAALLCGVGFTMSLLVVVLVYETRTAKKRSLSRA